MYRQPENSNRVKSMKSKFEGLNKQTPAPKPTPIITTKSVIVKVVHDKPKIENNNNDYTPITPKKEKFGGVNRLNKDFSGINKKELCTAPPLNLTRQLNDPLKKGCIKRTPAFRKDKIRLKNGDSDDNFANIVKIFEPCNNETTTTVRAPVPLNEMYAQVDKSKKHDTLTDTLKAALKQPLPSGPPPKKPPRTFAHTPTPTTTPTKQQIKSDPKRMLQKLENALLTNKIRSPKLPKKLTTFQPNLFSKSPMVKKKQEPIYAEPFHEQNHNQRRSDTLSSSLHYMSNPVCDWQQTESQSPQQAQKRSASDVLTRQKLHKIMNHTYATTRSPSEESDMDSIPTTPTSSSSEDTTPVASIKDIISNFEQKLEPGDKKFKSHLNRKLTEIRKTYVRRVCSTLKRKTGLKVEPNNLFECCLLVGLDLNAGNSNLQPYIKAKYPENISVPPWVEHLCFPDASEFSESSKMSTECQCYSLVITDEKGERKYGYCRRVVPEQASVCLPLCYCIISSYRAAGFYHRVLQELESRHGMPILTQQAFLKQLYNCKFPQPGETIHITHNTVEDFTTPKNTYNTEVVRNQSFVHKNKRMGQLFNDLNVNDNVDNHDVILQRPSDSRLEDGDLSTLFNTLNLETLIQTFGSLLHERKVIFVSNSLSKLSLCVEALQSVLYPFKWQHTFIPVLSINMLDILSAPLPLICGVLAAHIKETLVIEDGIAVNLDTSTMVCYMGDENEIIPKRLQKSLQASLQLVSESAEVDVSSKNVFVSDAFIRMFVEVCGCYKQFIGVNDSGQKVFQRDAFISNHPTKSKCIRWFLEWFSETAMFHNFVQSHLDNLDNGDEVESIFEQRCTELNTMQRNLKVAQKVKVFSHKLFH